MRLFAEPGQWPRQHRHRLQEAAAADTAGSPSSSADQAFGFLAPVGLNIPLLWPRSSLRGVVAFREGSGAKNQEGEDQRSAPILQGKANADTGLAMIVINQALAVAAEELQISLERMRNRKTPTQLQGAMPPCDTIAPQS